MNIYLIAGPPGIGKSTNAKHFIPKGIAIIDQVERIIKILINYSPHSQNIHWRLFITA